AARALRALRCSDAPGPLSRLAAARRSLVVARALCALGACRPRRSRARQTGSFSCFAFQQAADPEEGYAAEGEVELFPHVVADDAEVEADAHVGEAEGLQHLAEQEHRRRARAVRC